MANFNTFENHVDDILEETISSKLENITNKYDSKKHYYPNIRASFLGYRNISLDNVGNRFLNYINQLKKIEAWKDNDPNLNTIKNYISTSYSAGYIKQINELKQKAHIAKLQSNKLKSIITKLTTSGQTPNFFQKAQANTAQLNFDNLEKETQSRIQENHPIDPPEYLVEGSLFLRVDGSRVSVYRDKWEEFLNILQNLIIGSEQQRYTSGSDTYNIVTGQLVGEIRRRGGVEYKKTKAISPEILRSFHNEIMTPLFISGKNNYLIYCTPKYWESISKGGRLYKAITGLGREIYSAGKNQPKVRL